MFQKVVHNLATFVRQMSAASAGELPIFVVCGATGTGKTKLGVELASRYNGEVINVDVIQMYKGLDIATNKATTEEMQGVPHHLIGFLDPHDEDFNTHDFRTAALSLISDISARGRSPVLVGGTHYYLESLLWHFLETDGNAPSSLRRAKFSGLSNAELQEHLARLDPAAAVRVHHGDRRKLLNALTLAAEGKDTTQPFGLRFPGRVLGFWTDSRTDVLHARLDRRVEDMMRQGLVAELTAFHDAENRRRDGWQTKEDRYHTGIWQAIGFKELEPFLSLSSDKQKRCAGRLALEQSTNRLKLSTRQYARRQLKWINNRILCYEEATRYPIFRLDTSEPSQWPTAVTEPVTAACDFWLGRSPEERKDAGRMDWWKECSVAPEPVKAKTPLTYVVQRCDDCDRVFNTQEDYDCHIQSRKHKRCVAAKRKRKFRDPLPGLSAGREGKQRK